VPHSAIAPSLARKGIPAPLIETINKMYRRVKTKIKTRDGNGVEIEILRGVKQGDPLSPTLFNLCMEPLLEAVEESTEGININNNNKIPISAFADDIVLIVKDEKEAQKQLTMIQEYLEGLGMNISGDKSQTFQVISKKDTWYVEDKLAIKIKNIKIPNIAPEDAFRYLGATMGPWKGLTSGIIVPELMRTIKRVRKLSLKPGQKIELLQKYILPRYIFNLLISPLNEGVLKLLDGEIRQEVKGILHLTPSTATGFFYALKDSGGLGLPRFEHLVKLGTLKSAINIKN
jgi:hypothetical protein